MNNRAIRNSSHTALSRGSGRIENACGGITGRSPSFGDHLSWSQTRKTSGDPAPMGLRRIFRSSWGLSGAFFGSPGLSWRVLGESRGPLGGVLGRPGAISVKTFWL